MPFHCLFLNFHCLSTALSLTSTASFSPPFLVFYCLLTALPCLLTSLSCLFTALPLSFHSPCFPPPSGPGRRIPEPDRQEGQQGPGLPSLSLCCALRLRAVVVVCLRMLRAAAVCVCAAAVCVCAVVVCVCVLRLCACVCCGCVRVCAVHVYTCANARPNSQVSRVYLTHKCPACT